jgi:osmotically-inducible protein OsmY
MDDDILSIGMQGGFGRGINTVSGWTPRQRYFRRSDQTIEADVSKCIITHPEFALTPIEIHVLNGTVTLSGTVPNEQIKDSLEHEIEVVVGVRGIRNDLHTPDKSA